MFINLSDVFLSPGRPLHVSCPIEMTEIQNGYESFSIIEKSELRLTASKDRVVERVLALIYFPRLEPE